MNYVLKLDEIGAADVLAAGERGAGLAVMTRAGLPVPPGFCLSAEAYREFIACSHVDKTIRQILAGLQVNDPEDVEVRTEQVRNFLNAQQMPGGIGQEVLRGYYELGMDLGSSAAPVPVAVRPSATTRDLPAPSCSVVTENHLNVSGEANLLEHVKGCWGSLWAAQAVAGRVRQGVEHAHVGLAIIVQAMIQPEVSGILFAASPIAGSREEAVIFASWGLTEAIVSGLVSPDTFVVRKSDGVIVQRSIATKDRMIECAPRSRTGPNPQSGFQRRTRPAARAPWGPRVRGGRVPGPKAGPGAGWGPCEGGTIEREVPPERRRIPATSDAQIAELVALSAQVENLCGAPLDMEWAYAAGRVYIWDVGMLGLALMMVGRVT
jgi:phosphoenolpyruvate synthase/pyruvate phosphate dikinase